MEAVAQKISLYHHLFLGCLIVALICLAAAAALFFLLDIREVIGYLTGRQRRKKVKELEAANAQSGRLMKEKSSMSYVAQEMKKDMGVRGQAAPGARKVEHVVQEAPQPTDDGDAATDILRETSGEMETSLLREEPAGQSQTDIGSQEDGSTEILAASGRKTGLFRIEREIIEIHTDEYV